MVDVLVMAAVWDSENASVCEKNIIMPMDRCKLNCVTGTPTANLTIITFLFFIFLDFNNNNNPLISLKTYFEKTK